jgi:hypothetical protein
MQDPSRPPPPASILQEEGLRYPHATGPYTCNQTKRANSTFGAEGITTLSSGKIRLPQDALQILQLIRRKDLSQQLLVSGGFVSAAGGLGWTYLDIHVPCVLSRLLEVAEDAFDALAHHARIGSGFDGEER